MKKVIKFKKLPSYQITFKRTADYGIATTKMKESAKDIDCVVTNYSFLLFT